MLSVNCLSVTCGSTVRLETQFVGRLAARKCGVPFRSVVRLNSAEVLQGLKWSVTLTVGA